MSQEQEILKLKDEINDLCDTIKDKDKQIRELEDAIRELEEKLEDEENLSSDINTGRGDIRWEAESLLDQQLMEAFKDLVESKNSITLLQQLQEMNKPVPHATTKRL
jgi:chromosome segregation ATPase